MPGLDACIHQARVVGAWSIRECVLGRVPSMRRHPVAPARAYLATSVGRARGVPTTASATGRPNGVFNELYGNLSWCSMHANA